VVIEFESTPKLTMLLYQGSVKSEIHWFPD